MNFTSSRRRHLASHNINLIALSIVLHFSGVRSSANVGCSFVASGPRRQLPSFARTSPLPSRPSWPRPMAASGDEEDEPVSGSFFNEVPPPKDDSIDDAPIESPSTESSTQTNDAMGGDFDMFNDILQKTKLSRTPAGFSKTTSTTDHAAPSIIQTTGGSGSFVGIGKPLNDVNNPEYDENGYTLYADEVTGEKKRVFEALVEYPSVFKMKIVGKDDEEETFAPEMVGLVAQSCGVERSMVKHTKRKNGKWTSVTVHAPVKSADMLYKLYENVDKDPRVKFKF